MILESALYPALELETFESGVWTPWLGKANSVSISRGGKRNGISATVGVGTLTCTLINSGDPLAGGSLKPNLPIRIGKPPVGPETVTVAAATVYSQTFEGVANNASNPDSWVTVSGTAVNTLWGGSPLSQGNYSMTVGRTATGGAATTSRTITGLTVGLSTTVTAIACSLAPSGTTGTIGVSGIGSATTVAVSASANTNFSYTFVPTATSHTVFLTLANGSGSGQVGTWDNIVVTRNSYLAPNPAYVAPVPVFTGRIVDVDVDYAMDKSTGSFTTFVTISAADSVRAHAATTRYGAVTSGGAGFESWANRIIRLSTSSTTAINPPADDSPIVRYGI